MLEKTNSISTIRVLSHLEEKNFQSQNEGENTDLYWIYNDSMAVAITNYGGRIVGLWVPDQNGDWTDVVVGMGSVEDYINSTEAYFGATIGRVGNRIAKGRFSLDGKEYKIPVNNGENSLHGGIKGFESKVWKAEQPNDQTLVLYLLSPDGEEGFPGDIDVNVTYSVIGSKGFRIIFDADTYQATIVNRTNHTFFNINGEGSGNILDRKST